MSLPVLLAVTDPRYEEGLVHALERRELGVTVVRRCVDIADLLATAAAGMARAAILSGDLRRLDRDAVCRLGLSGVALVGVVPEPDDAVAERLRSFGVTHLLPIGADAQLVSHAVHEAVADRPAGAAVAPEEPYADPAAGPVPGGPGLVAVWGPTGAPGRTTVAANLAAELAELGVRTSLVDADTYGGSVAVQLGMLDEAAGLSAACRLADEGPVSAEQLAALSREVRPRLRVLTGLTRADRWPELRPAAYRSVLDGLRNLDAAVVVDCGFCLEQDEELGYDGPVARRNGVTLATLDAADVVVAVGAADPVGLVRLIRGVGELREIVPGCEPLVVANRVRASVQPGNPETEVTALLTRHLGARPAVLVPDDPRGCDAALRAGQPLVAAAKGSPARAAIRGLALTMAGAPRGRGWRRRR